MGASSASAAEAVSGGADSGRAGTTRPQEIRDIHLDGHFVDGNVAGRSGRRTVTQVDAEEVRLDDPALDPELRMALDYWERKRGGRLAPLRADIDPIDIAPLLPRVLLVDVAVDPLDFRFRLAGTGIFRIHGAELTNKRPLDLEPPEYAQLVHRLYCDVLARGAPIAHRLLIEVETRRSAYMRITLPLSDDGQAINRLLTVESYADSAQDLRDCLEEARRSTGR